MSNRSMAPAAPAPPGKRRDFLATLDDSRDELAKILPGHVSPDRVVRLVRTAWLMSPDLQRCDPGSVIQAVMRGAELGLEPGGQLRHAHLVPFAGQCQLILGYAGLLELARRTGRYRLIESRLVRERDAFVLSYTPEPVFRHDPHLGGDGGEPTHAYAYAKLDGGELAFEVMTHSEVEHVRRQSRSANSPAWKNWWSEMARKVVLKRLLKRLPLSVELATALEHDHATDGVIEAEARVAPAAGLTTTRTKALAARLGAARPAEALEARHDDEGPATGPQGAEEADFEDQPAPVVESPYGADEAERQAIREGD